MCIRDRPKTTASTARSSTGSPRADEYDVTRPVSATPRPSATRALRTRKAESTASSPLVGRVTASRTPPSAASTPTASTASPTQGSGRVVRSTTSTATTLTPNSATPHTGTRSSARRGASTASRLRPLLGRRAAISSASSMPASTVTRIARKKSGSGSTRELT